MVAKYKVLETTFIAPDRFREGDVIETPDMPGGHLQPLNEEAEEMMEQWYNLEVEEIDPKTGTKTGKMLKPNWAKRPATIEENSIQPTSRLVEKAPKDEPVMGLAEALQARTPTPAAAPSPKPTPAKPPATEKKD